MNRYFSLNEYKGSKKISEQIFSLDGGKKLQNLSVIRRINETENQGTHTEIVFRVNEKICFSAGISAIFEEQEWSVTNYVFAPAALYNGNRFDCVKHDYPPMLTREETEIYKGKTVISDVPRLDKHGNDAVFLEVGDLSTPCFGYFSSKRKKGFLLFFEQKNELGNFGITIKENAEAQAAQFIVSSPCVRENFTYGMATTAKKSTDTGVVLKKGDTITFKFTEYTFDCESITDFHNCFFERRGVQELPKNISHTIPWSHAFRVVEKKYNDRNWVENDGFYKSSEAASGIYRQWQTGWVGGGINTLPAILLGNDDSVNKGIKTLTFIFNKLQHRSGFLYGVYCDGRAYGDDFHNPKNTDIVMSRKNADALYYLIKHLIACKEKKIAISKKWERGVQRLADAFTALYRKNGELGQFIDMKNVSLYISGSASAGIAPAGLMLCGEYYKNEEYISVAQEIAQSYYDNYVAKGFTNGGPGEILSAPDSESSFGLLESYVVLYSCLADEKWLRYAQDTASLCAGWCVSYDYQYNENTQLYKRGVSTAGAVWANVQNKHAAPGICTLSGSSLFRLYRATGDLKYLELCRDIAHSITQFVSIPENPIYASYVWHDKKADFQKTLTNLWAMVSLEISKRLSLPLPRIFNKVGRINERVNLSDWEGKNNVGEVPYGSCWCEVSAMLTYLEIPAVYIQKDTGFFYALDHVQCKVISKAENNLTLALKNPTQHDAEYRLFIENNSDRRKPIWDMSLLNFQTVCVKAHETKRIHIGRRTKNA